MKNTIRVQCQYLVDLWASLFSEGRQVGVTEEVTFKLGPERPRGRNTLGLFQEYKEGQEGQRMVEGGAGGIKITEEILRARVSCRLYATFKFGLIIKTNMQALGHFKQEMIRSDMKSSGFCSY